MGPSSTANAASLLTPTISREKRVPYDPKFERALRGIEHGMKPRSKSLRRISQREAKDLLKEADEKRQAKHKGQVRAVKRMSGEG